MNRFNIFWLAICLMAAACMVASPEAGAANPLLDFGLPTSNINSASNRSNYAYNWTALPAPPTTPYIIPGDKFAIGSSGQTYHIDQITAWMVFGLRDKNNNPVGQTDSVIPANYQNLALWFGPDGGTITKTSTALTTKQVWYANGENYLRTDGAYAGLRELSFATDLIINGGQTYDFFVDGLIPNSYTTTGQLATWHVPSLTLTASTDGHFYLYEVETGIITESASNRNANIMIYGNLVSSVAPLPSTLVLLGPGVAALAVFRRKLRN